MKAISIRQPWAYLILHAKKDIENRSWPTRYRGRILIHASQKVDTEILKTLPLVIHDKIQTGGIVGAVTITDCVTESNSLWFEGPYGWVLSDPTPLPFVPLRGALSFFDVDTSWLTHQLSEPEAKAGTLGLFE